MDWVAGEHDRVYRKFLLSEGEDLKWHAGRLRAYWELYHKLDVKTEDRNG